MQAENETLHKETLTTIAGRASVRKFKEAPLAAAVRAAILQAAFSAPTAGAMMLYSVIEICEQARKERLAVLCDNQPFIATAPLVLIFVADYRKWLDLFTASNCGEIELPAQHEHRSEVGAGDLLLACQDAALAAQTAVIAAEALGVGSCYIGDILENFEEVAELLELPPATLPLSMLVFGYPAGEVRPRPHAVEHLLMVDCYQRATAEELALQIEEREQLYPTSWNRPDIEHNIHALYARKFTSGFMAEMNRSAAAWIAHWQS